MSDPTPNLAPDGPVELLAARTLFGDAPLGRRSSQPVLWSMQVCRQQHP